jgi:hypothetical protein
MGRMKLHGGQSKPLGVEPSVILGGFDPVTSSMCFVMQTKCLKLEPYV